MTTHGPLSPDVVDLVDHTVMHNHSGAPTDNPGGPHGNRNPGTALLRTARPESRRRSGGLTRVRSSRGVHRRSPQPPWRTITLGTRAPGTSGRPTIPAVVMRGRVQRIPTPSGCDPPNRKAHRRRSGAGGCGRSPHRAEAFATCAQSVERIKAEVSIWKGQHIADASPEWVGL